MFRSKVSGTPTLAALAAVGAVLSACDGTPVAPVQSAPATEVAMAKGGGGVPGRPVDISTCGTTISAPGKYALSADLSGCADGITITSSDVTLHLGGHTIPGQGTGGGSGLNLVATNNVSILGPGTVQQFLVVELLRAIGRVGSTRGSCGGARVGALNAWTCGSGTTDVYFAIRDHDRPEGFRGPDAVSLPSEARR